MYKFEQNTCENASFFGVYRVVEQLCIVCVGVFVCALRGGGMGRWVSRVCLLVCLSACL